MVNRDEMKINDLFLRYVNSDQNTVVICLFRFLWHHFNV